MDAHRRIALVFRLNVALALGLAVILFIGLAATIAAGLFGRQDLTLSCGGISIADLLGMLVLKPLDAISAAVVASQRLELVHMRLLIQLKACSEQPDHEMRLRYQTAIWDAVQKEIAAMCPPPAIPLVDRLAHAAKDAGERYGSEPLGSYPET